MKNGDRVGTIDFLKVAGRLSMYFMDLHSVKYVKRGLLPFRLYGSSGLSVL